MKAILFSCLFFLVSYSIQAQTWVSAGESQTGDKYYIHSEAVEVDYPIIKVWIKSEKTKYITPKGSTKKVAVTTSDKSLMQFNCDEKQMMMLSRHTYDSKGNIIKSYKVESYEQEWEDVIPETVGETLLKKVCALFSSEE